MRVSTRAISSIIAILAIIIVSGILVVVFLESSSKELVNAMEGIEDGTKNEDWEKVKQDLSLVEDKWSKVKGKWSMLLDHIEVDNIETSLTKMATYVETQEKSLALAELSTLRQFVKHIPRKEAFGLENIF